MKFLTYAIIAIMLVAPVLLPAQTLPPTAINYQGRVSVAGTPVEGTGYFKFLLYAPDKRLWSNDDSHNGSEALAAYEPSGNVAVGVAGGLFSADLGSGGMPAITSSVLFDGSSNVRSEVYLRIWFSTSSTGLFVKLGPNDRRLFSVPFALVAGAVAKETITTSRLAPDAVISDRISDGAIQTQDLSTSLQQAVTPLGTISATILDTAPPGWLLCDGQEKIVLDYPALAMALGTKFGVATAGSFKLPDLRGVFLRGVDDPDGLGGRAAAGNDPEAANRLPAAPGGNPQGIGSFQSHAVGEHFHGAGGTTANSSDGLTARVVVSPDGNVHIDHRNITDWPANKDSANADPANQWSAATHGAVVVGNTSRNLPVNTSSESRPKNISVNYIIKY